MRVIDVEYDSDGIPVSVTCEDDGDIYAFESIKHGRWIGVEYDGYADGSPVYDVWECSECRIEHYGEYDTLSDYCPNCSTKMNLENAK